MADLLWRVERGDEMKREYSSETTSLLERVDARC